MCGQRLYLALGATGVCCGSFIEEPGDCNTRSVIRHVAVLVGGASARERQRPPVLRTTPVYGA